MNPNVTPQERLEQVMEEERRRHIAQQKEAIRLSKLRKYLNQHYSAYAYHKICPACAKDLTEKEVKVQAGRFDPEYGIDMDSFVIKCSSCDLFMRSKKNASRIREGSVPLPKIETPKEIVKKKEKAKGGLSLLFDKFRGQVSVSEEELNGGLSE